MAAIGVITANVNGIRAAARRGGLTWLVQQEPDVLCLQGEASDTQLLKALADAGFGDWHVAHIECSARDARTSRWRAAGPYT